MNKLELKYRLEELRGKLLQETEEFHIWLLTAELGSHKGTKKIQREPTKAENEEQVSEEDRQFHEKIMDEVIEKLKSEGEEVEEGEVFDEFYADLKVKAKELGKEYQPKLRNGIKLTIDFLNSVGKDEKDGDVDLNIKIAPNNNEKDIEVSKNGDGDEAAGKMYYYLNARGQFVLVENEDAPLYLEKSLGDIINGNTYIATEAEYSIIKKHAHPLLRVFKTHPGFLNLYLNQENKVAFLQKVVDVFKLKADEYPMLEEGDEPKHPVWFKLKEYYEKEINCRTKSGRYKKEQDLTEEEQKILVDIYGEIPKIPITNPAMAIAYYKGEYAISRNAESIKFSELNAKIQDVINDINTEAEALGLEKDTVLNLDRLGSHAEVKAVSKLLNTLVNKNNNLNQIKMSDIFVATIRYGGPKTVKGKPFTRCGNCKIILDQLDVTPITDSKPSEIIE